MNKFISQEWISLSHKNLTVVLKCQHLKIILCRLGIYAYLNKNKSWGNISSKNLIGLDWLCTNLDVIYYPKNTNKDIIFELGWPRTKMQRLCQVHQMIKTILTINCTTTKKNIIKKEKKLSNRYTLPIKTL